MGKSPVVIIMNIKNLPLVSVFLISMCMIVPSGASVTYVNYTTNADDLNQVYTGQPGIYPDTSLDVRIHINVSGFLPSLKVSVTFPHADNSYEQCSVRVDRSTFDCVNKTNIVYHLGSLPSYSDLKVITSDIVADDYNTQPKIDGATLSWNFNNVTTSGASEGKITLLSKVNSQRGAAGRIGKTYDMSVGLLENGASTQNISVPILILGPAFSFTINNVISSGLSTVQAGDLVNHTFSMQLASDSTAAAKNIRVSIKLHNSLSYVANTGWYRAVNMSAAYPLGLIAGNTFFINIPSMNISDRAEVTFQTTVSSAVQIGKELNQLVTLTYNQDDATNHPFNSYRYFQIRVTDLYAGLTSLGYEHLSAVAAGQELTWVTNFSIPAGSMQSTIMEAVFQTPGYGSVSLTFLSAEVKYHPVTMSLRGSDIRVQQQSRRKKRATTTSTTVKVEIGSINNSGGSSLPVLIKVKYYIGSVASSGVSMTVLQSLTYNGKTLYFQSSSSPPVVQPSLYVNKTVQLEDNSVFPNIVRFNVTVGHQPVSSLSAYNVVLTDNAKDFEIFFHEKMIPPFSSPDVTAPSTDTVQYKKSVLPVSDTMQLSFKAKPKDEGIFLPAGQSNFTAYVVFYASSNSTHLVDAITASVCIDKVEKTETNLFRDHGFTVLMFLVGLLLGFVLIFLLLFLIYKLCLHRRWGSIRPAASINTGKLRGLITDTKAAMKKGFRNLKNLSMVALDESLILILALKDKLRIHRELDSLDIVNTIAMDTEIEKERNDAMIENSLQLVDSLRVNGDMNKNVQDKCVGKFNMNLKNLDKKLDDQYEKEMDDIAKKLANKNKDKLEELQAKHDVEMENLENKIRDLPEKEQEELKNLLKQQQETEREELAYLLRLEQDEAAEKLRKEFVIRKRMGIREEQGALLRDIAQNGQLTDQQLDWLLKEHKKNQDALALLYDDEILKQRMKLEEKLAQRKALAATSEAQEEMHSDVLNSMAGHEIQLIQKAKKLGTITEEEADAMIENAKKEMMNVKDSIDKEREKQEAALHKRLSERKRSALQEQEKKHQQEIAELEKQHKEQQTSGQLIDPISLLESKLKLKSHQRAEISDLENEIDKEHAAELQNIRDALIQQAETELDASKQQLIGQLKEEGLTDDQMKKLLNKHEKELEQLKEAQEKDREQQEENLKRALAQRRKNMNRRKEEERLENEQLRNHENKIVEELLDKQVAMSEDEREKIMREHEKNMMALENSMTLTKLQQKRMLEEKLAQKRAKHMEELEKKQLIEAKKKKKSAKRRDDSDEEEDEISKKEIVMMKKHAEQRLAVAQGETIELEQELEEVEEEMIKARAGALKDQEVRLAAMIADLQMQKAKEIAEIESQQQAISSLKSNLMDDLNERGVLSNKDCQRVIEAHRQEQAHLSERLESQKSRQEMILQKRLAERFKQRQNSLAQLQENQIKEVYHSSANSVAAKIRIAALRHRHAEEMDKFREKMENEMMQNLEELRRQMEIKQLQAQQDQELQFLSGLVRLGQFPIDELNSVVQMLFPTKTADERKQVLARLTEGYTPPPPPPKTDQLQVNHDGEDLNLSNASTLEARIKLARSSSIKNSPAGSQVSVQKKKPKKKKLPPIKSTSISDSYDDDFLGSSARSLPPIGYKKLENRPDPVGRSQSPSGHLGYEQYGDEPDYFQPNPRRKSRPNYVGGIDI